MNPEDEKPKDLSDPTFRLSDFRQQAVGGGLRWLASVLAVASLGLLIWQFIDNEPPEMHYPFHLKGNSVLWAIGGASAVWTALAVVNWISWFKKSKSKHATRNTQHAP